MARTFTATEIVYKWTADGKNSGYRESGRRQVQGARAGSWLKTRWNTYNSQGKETASSRAGGWYKRELIDIQWSEGE